MWQRVEKFSIRKFSFGAASCLIGAITVLGPSSQIAEANGITAYEANGDKVTLYAHGEDVYNLRRTSTSIYNAFRMNVDTSKYTKENPVITVTLTYNAPNNPNEKAPIFWSGRPLHWFTVPEGTEELGNDNKFSLTNANGTAEFNDWSSWGTNSRFVQGTNVTNLGPFRRKKNNDTTKEKLGIWPRESIDAEFNKVLGLNDDRWYDNSGMPTQDIMKDLRAKSQSIYLDWEKRAAETVTVTYTTKVKDPEKTKELTIGMGVYQELNGQQYARVETVKLPVLYKLNEVFEPKVPERTGVANPNQLTDDEVNAIKEKIWNANQDNTSTLLPADSNAFQENVKDKTENGVNSIEIDKNTGDATITYKDDTKDVIPGASLVYQDPDAVPPVPAAQSGYKYKKAPYPVEDMDNIKDEEIDAAVKNFYTVNGMKLGEDSVIKSVGGDTSENFVGKKLVPFKKRGTIFEYVSIIEGNGTRTGVFIPKTDLVMKKSSTVFDDDTAKTEANKLIESLDNLYPDEKKTFEADLKTKNTRADIETVVNQAKTKATENAVKLAEMKKEANDKINALTYLTKEEKEEAIKKINSATIKQGDAEDKVVPDTDANRDATKARLDSVVAELEKKNLAKAKEEAIKNINNISDENLPKAEKDKYIQQIKDATEVGPVTKDGTILNIVEKAQKEASAKEAARKKEEADKVRQQYKDMIAAIPGLTDQEKTYYNKAIEDATSTDEMAAIVEFAKLSGERKTAIDEIDKLDHLNNKQKQSFKELIENSDSKDDIEDYVSQAKQLNSKMKQLHDLVEKAKEIKLTDKYTKAVEEKRTAFDQALEVAQKVLDKANGTDKNITSVEDLFKTLKQTIENLAPGTEIKIEVDKSALKAEYDKGESVKESPLYKNSTDEGNKTGDQRREEYNKKLEAAKTILADEDAGQTDVDGALEDLLSAKADLNGKEDEFALTKKDEKAVPISVVPAVGVVISKPEDQKLIKDKIVGIPEGSTVIYNPIQEKGGKTVVPVKVTHENVSKEIEIEVVQSVASKVTPTVSTAKLSEVPTENGTITKAEDVQKVTEAVSVPVPEGQAQPRKDLVDNGKVVQGTDQRANGGANNTGKLVVKVEVTYQDGSKETVEVPVEGTEAAKSPLKDPEKVKVNDVNNLSEAETTAVKEAVKKANTNLTDNQISVDNTGKVTVTYSDKSKNELPASKTVEAKTEAEKALDKAKEKAKADLTKAADKEKAEIEADKTLTEDQKKAEKAKVDEAKKAAESNIDKAGTTDEVTIATEDGKKAIDAVHKTNAEKATPTVTGGAVEISVDPNTATNVDSEADKTAIKDAVTVPEGQPQPTKKEILNSGAIKDGKTPGTKVVEVKVTYGDNSSEVLEVPVVKKAEDFRLAVKDDEKPAEISKEPVVGENLTEDADKAAVKAKVTVNDKELDDTYAVEYEPIKEKDGKKVVPVKVTRDGITKTVEVPVVKKDQVFTVGVKDSTKPIEIPNTPTIGEDLKDEDKEKIKENLLVNGESLKAGDSVEFGKVTQEQDKTVVSVTVTRDGKSETIKVEVIKKSEPFKLTVTDSTQPVSISKEPVAGDKLTPEDETLVKNKVRVNGEELQANEDVTVGVIANEGGKFVVPVTVTRDGKSETIKVEVTKKSDTTSDQGEQNNQDDQSGSEGQKDKDKATPNVKDSVTAAGGVPVSVDPSNAPKVAEADKKAITEAVVVPEGQPQPTDKQVKNDGEIVEGTGANAGKKVVVVEVTYPDGSKDEIEVPVRKATDQEKAKADLTEAANTEKGEIGGDTTLTDKEKEALKAKVDEVKKAAEDKINNAKTPEEIAKATEEGKKAIADVYNPQTAKGQSTSIFKPGLDLQTALVSGKATVEKGKDLTDEEILKQLALADGVTAKVISKPTTTETGTKEAEVEVTLADGTKVTVKVPVEVVDSLGTADKDNDLAKAKEDAKKQVEEAAKAKITEIKKDPGLTEEQKQKAEEAINKAKEDANKAIDEASSAGTAKQIADQAKENIEKYDPKADTEVKKPDVTNLDEEKAKAKAEILEEAQKRIDEIKNNKDLSDEAKQKAIEEINKAKDKAIEDINKGQSKDEINAAKEAGIHKINEVQPDGSIASKFEPKVPENKVEVGNPAKLSDEEREQVRQNIEGANTFPDGTTVEVKPDGTAVITYKDGSSDTISKDNLVTPANKEIGTIASRTEPVIPGKTQVGNTTKLTPAEQATVKKAVEEANNFPEGTTVEVRPDGTVVITYPDKSVDTITGDKLVEKGSKQETPKVQTDAEKNPAQVPGNFVPVENTHNLTQTEQDTVAAKVKEANPAATDVKVSKDGTATLTYGDGSVNTIPGTSLVVAKDTDNEASTQAAQNPAVVPATTEVGNAHSLTPEEQAAVATKVKQANPTATDVKVSKDGTATLTYSDGSVNTIPGTSLVVQKEETSTQEQPTIAEKTKVIIPANPTKVAEATRLTDAEKEAVKKAVVDANGFGSDVKVDVAGDGTATIVFKDGSAITIPGNQLVAQDPKAQDSTKPTAEKSTVKAPAQRVDVKDITHLTDEEKEKVKVAILQANGSALDGATITVAGDGTATITFPDGSVVTILGKDTVQQSAKGESVTQEATPEYKPETTPGGDNGGNTGSSDANVNAGGGSQAGGQANTGSQTPAQSQASKQLATEKESAKKVIEKAAKDKQDEIKGAPLSDKEKAELLARVEAEKQAALKEIENAKTVEDVKEAEMIGVQAIAMVTVPKRPVAPNAAPQATSAPQATAGTMQDVTYQSPARKQLPNTASASSAALASLGLVAATSGFALLGRKARRRK